LAVIAGLVWTTAFPNIGLAGFAWLAPGLLVAAASGKTGGERFRVGFVGGLAHYLSMLYWLLLIPFRWHGVPLAPGVGWLALSSFVALYPAGWVWLVAFPGKSSSQQENAAQAPWHPWLVKFADAFPQAWANRTAWALAGAAAWVGGEMVLARFLGGFPWDLLGVSQYQMVPLIQMASVTGVYGVSFMIVWSSLGLLLACAMLLRRPGARSVWLGELFLPILVVAVLFNLGFRQLRHEPPPARSIHFTLIQPSIPQTVIWSAKDDDARFADLMDLTESALSNETDVLVWPEAALPKMLRYDTNTFAAISGLARRHHVYMIVGSDDAEPPRRGRPDQPDYFNSAFLIGPQGELLDRYIKRDLVIFGEYVPLTGWLPFLQYFTPIEGGFTPGTHAEQFDLPQLGVSTSVMICFEDVFPQLARSDVEPQTDFLVNITNDGWFGEGAAQRQQAASALFRTVENARPLVRCCNNGLTCWIDAHGRLRQSFLDARGTIYGAGFLNFALPLPSPGPQPLTFYTRHGDWFGWGCVAVTAVWLGARIVRVWRRR
jgi:apolipoprotein N-acyltransferase